MSYRCLFVANAARIHCKNEQLVIEADIPHSVPLEDISALILESRQISITSAALSSLMQNGAAVYCCDEKHLPCGICLPFAQHSRQLGVVRWQLELTQPAKKRLWQKIVAAKIANQAECLALCGLPQQASALYSRAKAVSSGDKENIEASAAAFYFRTLFGAGFTRQSDDGINAALNYAYAVLRGYVARCLAVYGFLPYLGIHHDSELNQFNLADDLIEPFRPVADLFVASNVSENTALTTALKGQLVNLLNADILSGEQHHSVSYAIERLVQSLRAAQIILPKLIEYKQHTYE